MIYIIGSLRNPQVPKLTKILRDMKMDVFADWYAAGPEADDKWRDYEKSQGFTYVEALKRPAAKNVFDFDRRHLEASEVVVLVLPAGKSGHLELGWALGRGKKGYILLDDPERWDVMYQFADGVFTDPQELINEINTPRNQLAQVGAENSRVHLNIPRLGISCACADCERDRRDLRGSGALNQTLIPSVWANATQREVLTKDDIDAGFDGQ